MKTQHFAPLAVLFLALSACGSPASGTAEDRPGGDGEAVETATPAPVEEPSPTEVERAPAPTAAAGTAAAKPSASAIASAAPGGGTIKIGVLDDVTGAGSIEGAEMRISTDLVIQQVNSSGGINGRQIEARYVDPKGQPDEALQLAAQLAQRDNVDVLAGGVFNSECLGVQKLMPKLGLVYVPLNGCGTEDLTARSCDKFTFRVAPAGKQTIEPAAGYVVKTFGKKWGILYPDYAIGQAQVATYDAAVKSAGGDLTVKIPIPLGETNFAPYVSKIPTDSSINGIFITDPAADSMRITGVIAQSGVFKRMAVVLEAAGREWFGGAYPATLNGAIIIGLRPSNPQAGNQFDAQYFRAFADMVAREGSVANALGGVVKATPGVTLGYQAYAGMSALKLAMRAAGFTGKADTAKLIAAFEPLTASQGLEFPTGPMLMNKADHQGRMPVFVMKINGQREDVLQTIPADQLPPIGTCRIGG